MSKIGRFSILGYALIVTQLLCLSACSMVKPANHVSTSVSAKSATGGKPVVGEANDGDRALKEHRVIVPSEEVAREGLQVSYSLKSVAAGADDPLQLSLVFRNANNKSMTVAPKVVLMDAKGVVLQPYTRKAFDKAAADILARFKHQHGKSARSEVSLLREQLEWDQTFWLPARFKIPAGGIQIGVLVFYQDRPDYPLSLVVESAARQFQFTIKDPAAAVVKKTDNK